MSEKKIKSRRDFLKKMMLGTVITATCPHVVLGRIEPKNVKLKDNKMMGMYHLNLNDYPILKEMWGSVKIRIICMDDSWRDIIVARVTQEKCDTDFTAVWQLCPHEGQEVSLLHPEEHIFVCSGHGTVFDACGHYIDGPAAEDLEIYPTHYDGGDDLFIDIFCYEPPASVEKIDDLAYMHPAFPNPGKEYTRVDYGLEKAGRVQMSLYSSTGNRVMQIMDAYRPEGHYTTVVNVSKLTAGAYLCKMVIDGKRTLVQKIMVAK